MRGVAFPGK